MENQAFEIGSNKALEFVNKLVELMDLDCKADLEETDEKIRIVVSGNDSNVVIGYRGDVLDAIQYLTLLVSNKGECEKKIVVDTENYRAKRTETLKDLALKLADKADRTGRKIELEPMNPFERRVIHAALADSDKATTESIGEDPNRHIVIIPKNPKRRHGGGYNKGNGAPKKYQESAAPASSEQPAYDPYAAYDGSMSNFKHDGPRKMRSFGYKKPRF